MSSYGVLTHPFSFQQKITISKPAGSLQLPVHELGNSKLGVCNASRSLYQSLQDHCNCQYNAQGHCIQACKITAIALQKVTSFVFLLIAHGVVAKHDEGWAARCHRWPA
jgi:hypothetical protein